MSRLAQYWRLSQQRAQEGGLSLPRQLVEMSLLSLAHGLGPGYYHLAGLWRQEIPFRDKWQHLGGRAYTRAVARLNPEHYRVMSQHKFAEKSILEHLSVPCMRFAGYATHEAGRCADGSPLASADDFVRLLTELGWDRICVKTIEGYSGKGFVALDVQHGRDEPLVREIGSDDFVGASTYWSSSIVSRLRAGVLLEAYLVQHPDYARFNASSVNTLRLWIRQNAHGAAEVLLGYLRIGREGALVDNQSAGGIVVPFDLDTGVMRSGLCGTPQRVVFERHPDHNAPLRGEKLVRLDEAKRLACQCLELFPGLSFVGIDVAMAVDGPVIVELNAAPDRQGSAFVDMPSAPLVQ